jgi:hypothetical protein
MKYLVGFCLYSFSLFAEVAYVQLSSSATQIPSPPGKGVLIFADSPDFIKNFDLSPKRDLLICKVPGIYFFSCSLQPAVLVPRTNGYLDCWFELNGKSVEVSGSRLHMTENSPIGVMTIPLLVKLAAGDTAGVCMSASGPNIGIVSIVNDIQNEANITGYILSVFKVD